MMLYSFGLREINFALDHYAVVALLLGIIIWAFGWKLYKLALALSGFVLCAAVCYFFSRGDFAAALIGGLIGAILAVALVYVVVFFLGMLVSVFISAGLVGVNAPAIIYLIFAIIMGIVFVCIFKFIIMVITSFVGSTLMVAGFVRLAATDMNESRMLGSIILLTFIGVIFQYAVLGEPKLAGDKAPAAEPAPTSSAVGSAPVAETQGRQLSARASADPPPARAAPPSPRLHTSAPESAPSSAGLTPAPRGTSLISRPEYLEVIEGLPEREIRFRCPAGAGTVEYQIGRGGGSWDKIALNAQSVSDKHATIQFLPGVNLVINHSEAGLTRVNGIDIPSNMAFVIRSGDNIQFGGVKCILRGCNP
jgi:hypothetical protein